MRAATVFRPRVQNREIISNHIPSLRLELISFPSTELRNFRRLGSLFYPTPGTDNHCSLVNLRLCSDIVSLGLPEEG